MNVDRKILNAAIYENVYSPMTPWVNSIGMCSPAMRYQENSALASIAESYFVNSVYTRSNTEDTLSIASYLRDTGVTMTSLNETRDNTNFNSKPLERNTPLNLSLGNAITQRRSIRRFTGESMHYNDLASLLRAAIGVSAKANFSFNAGDGVTHLLRTYASAGGLYPINLYFSACKIDSLSQGIYRYEPRKDTLIHYQNEKEAQSLCELISIDTTSINLTQANCIILLTIKMWKNLRKYGNRGLRFAFYDVGAISQNIALAVTALGLGSVDCASFYEDEVNNLLNIDGQTESFVHAIVIGQPDHNV